MKWQKVIWIIYCRKWLVLSWAKKQCNHDNTELQDILKNWLKFRHVTSLGAYIWDTDHWSQLYCWIHCLHWLWIQVTSPLQDGNTCFCSVGWITPPLMLSLSVIRNFCFMNSQSPVINNQTGKTISQLCCFNWCMHTLAFCNRRQVQYRMLQQKLVNAS